MSADPTFERRGFADWPEVTDDRGVSIRVAESSAATGPCLWIFVEGGEESYGRRMDGSAHLALAQAKEFHDTLGAAIRFMETRFDPVRDEPTEGADR